MELTKSDFNKDRNDVLAALIKRAGPRAQPSTELETKVRGAVYAEWQRSLNEHRQRRNVRWLAAAAVGALVITFGWRAIVPHAKSVEIATIEYSRGDVRINATALADNTRTAWLHSGDEVRTNRNSGARLVLKNSANIRVAANTQLRWRAADEVELVNGSIYIDSGAQHAPLKITTRYGEVSHLGTRYRVRVSADTLSVGVRDGKVAVTNS
ncbi:MAG TPA: FecR family protein, partial [Steroidobacteraceae bacterium]|nr:FecR family protein [Steroidobacteraceae bacterium]